MPQGDQLSKKFDEFFSLLGFEEYPFSVFSAENERARLESLFVKPLIYSPLVETFDGRSTVIVSGERGSGKTALIYELMRNVDERSLIIYIEDFSELALDHSSEDLYKFLIDSLAEELIKKMAADPWSGRSLTKDERLLVSYLLKYHINGISLSRVEQKIREVQIDWLSRLSVSAYNIFRGLLNYFTGAAISITSDIVRKHFPWLPEIASSDSREYFPALKLDSIDEIQKAKANFSLLEKVAALVQSLGNERVVFILDKIDEEEKLQNDAAEIAKFLERLLCDNKLLLHSKVQFLIACWTIPLDQLKSRVRFQKLSVQKVSWEKEDLLRMLNQRLSIYSNDRVNDIYEITEDESKSVFADILNLANGNPRDLWHIMDAVLKSQFELNSSSIKLTSKALEKGAYRFVRDFNFYEYYPRSANARSNSMDVYSYIAHLQKLSAAKFTKNQLNEQAKTGGSTNNYVVAMENIGLISKTEEKGESGSVIYEIRDPKIIYANFHGISLTKG